METRKFEISEKKTKHTSGRVEWQIASVLGQCVRLQLAPLGHLRVANRTQVAVLVPLNIIHFPSFFFLR